MEGRREGRREGQEETKEKRRRIMLLYTTTKLDGCSPGEQRTLVPHGPGDRKCPLTPRQQVCVYTCMIISCYGIYYTRFTG